jgi:hypothetical protein
MAETRKAAEKRAQDPDAASEQVQQAVDAETERGLRGEEVDSTPNEHYTVAGVLADKPVPETAEDPAEARREAARSANTA